MNHRDPLHEPRFTAEQLEAWSGGRWQGRPAGPARGFSHDTRTIESGNVFVALRGARRDGHGFVRDALSRGAWAALVDEAYIMAEPPGSGMPLLVTSDTRASLARIAAGHRARLGATVIGVTGSLGKSTVKEMTADVLAQAGPTTRSPGSWNNDLGVPLSLLRAAPSDAFGVFEVGMNHPGELAPLCALLQPHWAVLTRVGPVHTEFFESEEAIAREKATLLRALPPEGIAVLAPDEPWYEVLADSAPGRVITLAFETAADYTARCLPDGGIEVREPGGERYSYPLSIPGEPLRRNALRAIVVGREHGVAPASIARTLQRFQPLPMRGEVTTVRGVEWVNDAYNANPLSMAAALDAFSTRPARRRWLVLGGMHELADPEQTHRDVGRTVAQSAWAGLVGVGERGRWMVEGAREAGFPSARLGCCRDVAEAAAYLGARLEEGDAVLLKGSRSEAVERVAGLWAAAGDDRRMD